MTSASRRASAAPDTSTRLSAPAIAAQRNHGARALSGPGQILVFRTIPPSKRCRRVRPSPVPSALVLRRRRRRLGGLPGPAAGVGRSGRLRRGDGLVARRRVELPASRLALERKRPRSRPGARLQLLADGGPLVALRQV